MQSTPKGMEPWRLMPSYALIYSIFSAYANNLTKYMQQYGLSESSIGLLLSIGPIVGMVVQPFWGAAGDRMRYKNILLILLLLATALITLGMGLWPSAAMIGLLSCVMAVFFTSIPPLLDTISLEVLSGRSPFGHVRMVGTLSYAICSPIIGILLANRYEGIPWITTGLLAVSALSVLMQPRVAGHAVKGESADIKELFRHPGLLMVTAFAVVLVTVFSMAHTFFPLYYTSAEVGGTSALLGWCFFIAAISEVPFLLFSDRLFKRLGAGWLLILCAGAMALRWALLAVQTDKYLILSTQVLQGMMYIVLSFSIAKYVDQVTPKAFKATAQMLFCVMCISGARALGTFLGGWVAQSWGYPRLFMLCAVLSVGTLVAFGLLIIKNPALLQIQAEDIRVSTSAVGSPNV